MFSFFLFLNVRILYLKNGNFLYMRFLWLIVQAFYPNNSFFKILCAWFNAVLSRETLFSFTPFKKKSQVTIICVNFCEKIQLFLLNRIRPCSKSLKSPHCIGRMRIMGRICSPWIHTIKILLSPASSRIQVVGVFLFLTLR